MLGRTLVATLAGAAGLLTVAAGAPGPAGRSPAAPPPQAAAPPAQQPQVLELRISGGGGAPPRFAVPDFIALSPDADTQAAARTIGQVLWDDLAFEREFDMIPRDTYASIPRASSMTNVPFDRWRELGADGLVIGTVEMAGSEMRVAVRLFQMRDRRQVFGKEYRGSGSNPRLYAHTIADEIHEQQVALRGVARTRLAFTSDRDGERVAGTVESREVKEIYIADYDGANPQRVTVNRRLNITPSWSPDGRAIAYTSYQRGFPDIRISFIYQGDMRTPTEGKGNSYLPAWSPDGTKIAFMSTRDGNAEIYVMNADGSGVRRLTNHPSIDVTPTWSPSGTHIAFTSDRSGAPQIYVMSSDGVDVRKLTSESYCDRPTWSPAPYNEIAYASRTGPGYDIMVLDLTTGERRQLTFGEGGNESPVFAPNGRHLAFASTRTGSKQIFTIARDGRRASLRQITRTGNNETPNWSAR